MAPNEYRRSVVRMLGASFSKLVTNGAQLTFSVTHLFFPRN